MEKAILISIKPEWVSKILNGEKTIEVRKTAPKCELPIEVYIYCTKSNKHLLDYEFEKDGCNFFLWDMKSHRYPFKWESDHYFNGKVVAKFTLRNVHKFDAEQVKNTFFKVRNSCLTNRELTDYAQGKDLYGWNISDLVIFDEPKELSEFYLKKAPQSWCYVEKGK